MWGIRYTDSMGEIDATRYQGHLAAALLIDARHRAGLTQAQLAERASVDRPSISRYETGRQDPSVTMLARLISACGMELRVRADILTEANRSQYERDMAVGPAQAIRNAERARREVVSIRKISEQDHLTSGMTVASIATL